jgi:hypothetical protein
MYGLTIIAQPDHWTERGRATSVFNSDAIGRPRRSLLSLCMSAILFQMSSRSRARFDFLLGSCLTLAFALIGHVAFARHWPNFWRLFWACAYLSAPLFLCIGVMVLLQHDRSWQMVVGVVLSAVACAIVGVTVYHLLCGLYWA